MRNLQFKGLALLAVFIPFLLGPEKPAKVAKKSTRTDCRRKGTVVSYPVLNFEKKKSGADKNKKKSKRNRFSFPV